MNISKIIIFIISILICIISCFYIHYVTKGRYQFDLINKYYFDLFAKRQPGIFNKHGNLIIKTSHFKVEKKYIIGRSDEVNSDCYFILDTSNGDFRINKYTSNFKNESSNYKDLELNPSKFITYWDIIYGYKKIDWLGKDYKRGLIHDINRIIK